MARYVWEKYSIAEATLLKKYVGQITYIPTAFYGGSGSDWYRVKDINKVTLIEDVRGPRFSTDDSNLVYIVPNNLSTWLVNLFGDETALFDGGGSLNVGSVNGQDRRFGKILITPDNPDTLGYWMANNTSGLFFTGSPRNLAHNIYIADKSNSGDGKGSYIGLVSSNSSSTYPSNGEQSGYWYVYKGSDNVDVIAVDLSSGAKPGSSATVTLTTSSGTYKGIITYVYEYKLNNGSWLKLSSGTINTAMSYTIPSDATSVLFRAYAKDNYGYLQANYVTSSVYTFATPVKAYVGISGTARQVKNIYIGVNGVARKVTKGYIGVNGVAQRFL